MKRYLMALAVLAVLAACTNAEAAPAPPIPAEVGNALVTSAGPDSLISTVRWTNVNDGKGPIDSMLVRVTAMTATPPDNWVTQRFPGATPPTTAVFRQQIPLIDAGYDIKASVCVYRGGKAGCATATAARFNYEASAPPAPTGLSVTNATN